MYLYALKVKNSTSEYYLCLIRTISPELIDDELVTKLVNYFSRYYYFDTGCELIKLDKNNLPKQIKNGLNNGLYQDLICELSKKGVKVSEEGLPF